MLETLPTLRRLHSFVAIADTEGSLRSYPSSQPIAQLSTIVWVCRRPVLSAGIKETHASRYWKNEWNALHIWYSQSIPV